MNPAPLTANIDVEFNNSCNGCCLPRPQTRRARLRQAAANTAKLNEIRDRELAAYRKEVALSDAYKASVINTATVHKTDEVAKDVLEKVAE